MVDDEAISKAFDAVSAAQNGRPVYFTGVRAMDKTLNLLL